MRLTSTLSGKEEELVLSGPVITMYVCGITPYDSAHLGHAMSYIIFDVLRRYLEYRGFPVRHVQNFTDVDDRIIARAVQSQCSPAELADRYIQEYFQDMDALHVQRAHEYPRATGEIPNMIEMIQGLIDKDYAYVASGDVYFRVARVADYGKLSHRTLEGMMPGARVATSSVKEHPMDFVLWKGAKPGEPDWESPWGRGRPGWHIECSAMARSYLAETVDIHGGGQDLIFPHHENEIVQAESFSGKKPFVRFWIHHGLMLLGEDKMSKSLGNLVPIQEALTKYSPDAIRLFALGSHYRSPLTYSEQGLAAAEQAASRLRVAASTGDPGQGAETIDASQYKQRFLKAMDDDLNTPRALAALFDLATEINRSRQQGYRTDGGTYMLRELTSVLGLTLEERATAPKEAEPFIELLLEVREQLRQAKQWALADKIRERLADLGVALEDTASGTIPIWGGKL